MPLGEEGILAALELQGEMVLQELLDLVDRQDLQVYGWNEIRYTNLLNLNIPVHRPNVDVKG